MGLFDNTLSSGESLFKNEDALDPAWVPKLLPYRDYQQRVIASCIKPLLQDRDGRNVFICGAPGIGKTAATKWVLRDLEENSDDVIQLYVNCWQKNTTYKIYLELCQQIGYTFVQNKKSEELFDAILKIINKKPVVLAFDEIDKVDELDFLYAFSAELYKKSILIITNYSDWLQKIEARVQSRLLPELVEFKPYTKQETEGILKQRIDYSFVSNIWNSAALNIIVERTFFAKDIRVGLQLLREAGRIAENYASKKILQEHAEKAIQSVPLVYTQGPVDEDAELILHMLKEGSESKIGDLYVLYKKNGGKSIYKAFQRKIEKLEKGKFIKTKKIIGGKEGSTTVIQHNKTLTDY
ncbi:AAA family ATPase [Candidatus Woesearchaeota archaeon]|nr:AAA family ATPase [Candidatus Woesearchaeota archaeon]